MVILGIDPGTATTGYGLIEIPEDILSREYNYGIKLIHYNNISTPKDIASQYRLLQIHNELNDVIEKYKPDMIAIEMLFFGANTKTAIAVGQARGVLMLAAAKHQIPVHEYTGLQVKLMVAGAGRADKKQVHEGVRNFLGENGIKRNILTAPKGGHLDDATDALAIAICHVIKMAAK